MNQTVLNPGFSDPVQHAQQMFRTLLHVMSHPGEVKQVEHYVQSDNTLNTVITSAALSLLDYETPYWLSGSLNSESTRNYLSFHTGAKKVDAAKDASFLLVGDVTELPSLSDVSMGTPEYPDSSATVFLAVSDFNSGQEVSLTGPGIKSEIKFAATELSANFWQTAQKNNSHYPLGIDFFFCSSNAIAALPRSTTIRI